LGSFSFVLNIQNADFWAVFDGRERYEAALESVQASGKKKDDEAIEMHHVERGS
jgi:hypothetical protein